MTSYENNNETQPYSSNGTYNAPASQSSRAQDIIGRQFEVTGVAKAENLKTPNKFHTYTAFFKGSIDESGESFQRYISSNTNKTLFSRGNPEPIEPSLVDGKTWNARAIVHAEKAKGDSDKLYYEFDCIEFDLDAGETTLSDGMRKRYRTNPFFKGQD